MRGDQRHSGRLELLARLPEKVLAFARMRIDDQDGLFGNGFRCVHEIENRPQAKRIHNFSAWSGRARAGGDEFRFLPRDAHAPQPLFGLGARDGG
jgi:hypothetical protein